MKIFKDFTKMNENKPQLLLPAPKDININDANLGTSVLMNLESILALHKRDSKKVAEFMNKILSKNSDVELIDSDYDSNFKIEEPMEIYGAYAGGDYKNNCLVVKSVSDDMTYIFDIDKKNLSNFAFKFSKKKDNQFLSYLKKFYKENYINVKTAYLSMMELKSVDGVYLPNLEEFACDNNQLTTIDLANFPNLEILIAPSNKLKEIKNLNKAKKLRELHISNNNLVDIDGVEDIPSLKFIDCYNNDFSERYIENLRNYCALKKITLRVWLKGKY